MEQPVELTAPPYANITAEVPYLETSEVGERWSQRAFDNLRMAADVRTSVLEVDNPRLLLLVEHDIRFAEIAMFKASFVNGREAAKDVKPTNLVSASTPSQNNGDNTCNPC